jgi:radical SAM superfamily enzyme YgiQ (UPF0313 family)
MKKPKLLIIVLFQNLGEENPWYAQSPAPPLPGILLAGMTPDIVDVEVLHEMVRPIDYRTDADFVAISFMDYLAPHAYEVASRFKAHGKVVVGGGKFVSTFPDETAAHFDSILVGEAQGVWPEMVRDMVAGTLKPRYFADDTPSLRGIPPPRYDLVESKYEVPVVTETSRGCPHPCTYCQLNIRRIPYRIRPVEDIVRDLTNTSGLPWHKRKMAMILDNNFGGDMAHAKAVLREVAKLKFWGVGTQFSIECLRDQEFIDLLSKARARMAFIGLESLNEESLRGVRKNQNKVEDFKEAFKELHRRGILTFAGYMFALEGDTPEYYETLCEKLDDVGVAVILPSIAIPIYGTPWYRQVAAEGRLTDTNLAHYEGDHLVFRHPHLTEEQVHEAYHHVNQVFFSWRSIFRRWVRLIMLQQVQESIPQFILKVLLFTGVYFKLSIFQRHHAQVRVLSRASDGRAAARERTTMQQAEETRLALDGAGAFAGQRLF